MSNELSLHLISSLTLLDQCLTVRSTRELINSLAWAELDKVARQGLQNLVCFHPDMCLTMLDQLHKRALKAVIRDQVSEHADVSLAHQR